MIKALYVEGDCADEVELDCDEFTAKNCLAWYIEDRDDADDWCVMDDMLLAGIEFVQIGENVEGETRKFFHILEE